MTTSFKCLLVGVVLVASSTMVQAAPISYTYSSSALSETLTGTANWSLWKGFYVNPGVYQLNYDWTSGSWSNEGSPTSYDPAVDSLTALDITLNFAAPSLASWILESWKDLSISASLGDVTQTSKTAATISLQSFDLTDWNMSEFSSGIELALTQVGRTLLTGYTLTFTGTRNALQQVVAVPTPSSLALLSAGLLGAGWISRRRRQSADS